MKYRSITACDPCGTLLSNTRVNLESDAPPEWFDELEVIAHKRTSPVGDTETDGRDEIRRCRSCGTYWRACWWKDTGHSFMDPHSDELKVDRLTPDFARSELSRTLDGGDTAAAAAELDERLAALNGEMESMVLESRWPNEKLRDYAVDCIVDAALAGGGPGDALAPFLRHIDPAIRVDVVGRVLWRAAAAYDAPTSPAVVAAAKELVGAEDTVPMFYGVLVGVLKTPSRKNDAWGHGVRGEKNTHLAASRALSSAAHTKEPFHPTVVDGLLSLLLDPDKAVADAAYEALHWFQFGTVKDKTPFVDHVAGWTKVHTGNAHGKRLLDDLKK